MHRISHLPGIDQPLPPGAIYVGPGTRFATPFRVQLNHLLAAIDTVTHPQGGRCWIITGLPESRHETRHRAQQVATEYYRLWLHTSTEGRLAKAAALTELRDATALACPCHISYPCHVDALINLLDGDQ